MKIFVRSTYPLDLILRITQYRETDIAPISQTVTQTVPCVTNTTSSMAYTAVSTLTNVGLCLPVV